MFTKLRITFFLLACMSSFANAVTTTCMNYGQFPLGAEYSVGTDLTYGDIYSELVAFQWIDGQWDYNGYAEITNGNLAQGNGKEVMLNNINQRFIFNGDHPLTANFKYADWGGNVNLGVNGTLSNVEDFSELNGQIVNGVQIVVTRTDVVGGHYGTVALISVTSDIERFGFGGQEFFADEACVLFAQ